MGQRDFTGELRISTDLGETEPLPADREVPAANKSLDNESRKNYPVGSAAIGLRALLFSSLTMTVLWFAPR